MAIPETGVVFTWGSCAGGTLGHGRTSGGGSDHTHPRKVAALRSYNIVAIAAGSSHALVATGLLLLHYGLYLHY